jgi:hypothetical protein
MLAETIDQDSLAKQLAEARPNLPGFTQLDTDALSDGGLTHALVASERLMRFAAWFQARVLGVLAGQRSRYYGLEAGAIEAEVAAVTRWAPSVIRDRLDTAEALLTRFPETLALLCAGEIAWLQAVALVEITGELEREAARQVQERVLSRMPGQALAATRKALRRAVLAADPQSAARRHAAAATRRRVSMRVEEDAMATVELYTTAPTAAAVMAAVNAHATKRIPGDPRSADQRRADAFARLVLAGAGVRPSETQGPAALVHVTVGIGTLLGVDEQPGELAGYGPIDAVQARALSFAPGSVWRRLITKSDGSLLRVDAGTYRPSASVARLVRERDRACVFPGCSMPAARCDLDHITPFNHADPAAGGASAPENLHALCRRHHRLKTAGRWTPVRESDGATTWTSATGHVYRTSPPRYSAA